ncbi:hypothetical protein [Pseudothauera rhizosphaerae]|uniref:Uncharacterized protein n=1 Tax=Pseudothauera rhizosphaerae TaxID=2565932 RepID=A0A4S4B0F7_9RHOO|nr:hypothetical protein [Pseudothauera rhizosphaerae]THF64345.1 hypothetical protein E6O51_03275 [Pseudothauera rhizosphaerae]
MSTIWVIYFTTGILAAVIALPWRKVESPAYEHWGAWVGLWPVLLLVSAWAGVLAYRNAWRRYHDRREAHAQREDARLEERSVFANYGAGKIVRETYFKRKE